MSVLLIASLAVAAAAKPPAEAKVRCTLPVPTFTGQPSPTPHQLTRLPAGSLYLTVDRRVEGCPSPRIVPSTISDKG
jgi:hypothetical protein